MNNIKSLKAKNTIVFEGDNDEILILIEKETNILVTTDKTDFEEFYSGLITRIENNGLMVEGEYIPFEYIESIEII